MSFCEIILRIFKSRDFKRNFISQILIIHHSIDDESSHSVSMDISFPLVSLLDLGLLYGQAGLQV